jgi:NhaA family Na+:H+ antiporter
MAVPALIYLAGCRGVPELTRGWAIPAATDIAFAIGVLALLGKRAPTSLKLFLTTVAIVDDMGAVAIIALFYTAKLNLSRSARRRILLAMFAMGRFARAEPAALSAAVRLPVVRAMLPVGRPRDDRRACSPHWRFRFERRPGTRQPDCRSTGSSMRSSRGSALRSCRCSALPMPGSTLGGPGPGRLLAPLPLGIAAGLFLGKQIGIFGSVWLRSNIGIARRLGGATWLQIYGVALLCGIGFTMSLFIGGLAFADDAPLVEEAKIGILMGSLIAALAGYAVLRFAPPRRALAIKLIARRRGP